MNLIEHLPTWRVWRLLHTYPASDVQQLQRVLNIRPPHSASAFLHNAWTWVVINLVVIGILFRFAPSITLFLWIIAFALGLLISVYSLRFALKVTAALSKLRQQGTHDVFALPDGAFNLALNVCRAYRYPLNPNLSAVAWLLGAIGIAILFVLLSISNHNDEASFASGFEAIFAIMGLAVLATGFARFVDYLQSFTAAAMIALFVTRRQTDAAQTRVLIGFGLLQSLCYVVVLPLLLNLVVLWQDQPFEIRRDLDNWWLSLFVWLAFMLCREIINLILWQIVKRRMEA